MPPLVSLTRRPHVLLDRYFGADGTGEHDSTKALQDACEAAHDVELPEHGTFDVRYRQTVSVTPSRPERIGVDIPSDTRIRGHRDTVIRTRLDTLDQDVIRNATDNGRENAVSWLWLGWDRTNITIEDLTFEGEGPAHLTMDTAIENLQSAPIDAAYEHWESRGPEVVRTHTGPERIRLRRLHFRKQFGFTAHARGGGRDWLVEDCTALDCMNGLNLNVDQLTTRNNLHRRSEGFENSGSGYVSIGDRFIDALFIAFAFGGHAGDPRTEHMSRDARILWPEIDGSGRYGLQITTLTENALVYGARVSRCRNYGLFAGDFGRPDVQPRNLSIESCEVTDCGGVQESAAFALLNVLGARLRDCRSKVGVYPGYTQASGLLISGGRDIEVSEDCDFEATGAAIRAVRGAKIMRLPRQRADRAPFAIAPDVEVAP